MVDRKRKQNIINDEVVERREASWTSIYELLPAGETIEIPEPTYPTLYEPTKLEEDGKRNGELSLTMNYLGVETEVFTPSSGPLQEKQIERLLWKIRELEAANNYLGTRVKELQDLLTSTEREKLEDISDALVDKPAVFILDVLCSRDSIELSEAERNIDSARGWMMLARLLKAGLIATEGEELYITKTGREFHEKIARLVTSSGK